MQNDDFSIALLENQSLLCLTNKDKVTFLIENADKTVENVQERSETVMNRPGTVNGLKRSPNHGHGTFTVRSRSRFKNERNTVDKPFFRVAHLSSQNSHLTF
jgi:hypothetical protein